MPDRLEKEQIKTARKEAEAAESETRLDKFRMRAAGAAAAAAGGFQRVRGHRWFWKIVILLIIGVIAFIYLFIFTDLGKQGLNRAEEYFGGSGDPEKAAHDIGLNTQLQTIKDILTGNFDAEGLWNSEAVQSEYSAPEDFELVIKDVEPLKSTFKDGEDIVIIGRINLVSGFDKTTTVELDVEPNTLCTKSGGDGDCSPKQDWTCIISGSDEENIFHMEKIYNRQFSCSHSGISGVDDTEVVSGIKVKWRYSTSAVAGKQVYVFNTNILDKYEDVLGRYDITDENLDSWYVGDENVNLGLGLSKGETVRAEVSEIAKNYVGISIENTGIGDIADIESLSVSFPDTDGIYAAGLVEVGGRKETIFEGPTTEVVTVKGTDVITRKFTLSADERDDFEPLEPGEYTTYYIPFLVSEEYVGDSDFRSFLVKAEIRYKYMEYEPVAVKVK